MKKKKKEKKEKKKKKGGKDAVESITPTHRNHSQQYKTVEIPLTRGTAPLETHQRDKI